MRARLVLLAILVGYLALSAGPTARAEPDASDFFSAPSPGAPLPFDFGPDWRPYSPNATPLRKRPEQKQGGASTRNPATSRDETKQASEAARAEALKKAFAPRPVPAVIRRQRLDELFERLRNASNPDTAKAIADSIEHLWLETRSDTADLLMRRAFLAVEQKQYPLALSLLDKIIALEPDWAEAWNRRATTRFLADDLDGAMADIDHVMKLEPRHFGALAGMGVILRRAGLEKPALQVFNRALAIYPLQPELQKIVERLTLEVEGRDI